MTSSQWDQCSVLGNIYCILDHVQYGTFGTFGCSNGSGSGSGGIDIGGVC